jgi:hypothetical protein
MQYPERAPYWWMWVSRELRLQQSLAISADKMIIIRERGKKSKTPRRWELQLSIFHCCQRSFALGHFSTPSCIIWIKRAERGDDYYLSEQCNPALLSPRMQLIFARRGKNLHANAGCNFTSPEQPEWYCAGLKSFCRVRFPSFVCVLVISALLSELYNGIVAYVCAN